MYKCFTDYRRGLCNRKKKVIKLKEGLKINKSAIFKRNARHQYFVTRISSVEYYS